MTMQGNARKFKAKQGKETVRFRNINVMHTHTHTSSYTHTVVMLTFIRDLVTLLHLLVAALLHWDVGALRPSVGLLTLLLIHRGADWLPVVVAHLVVLGVAHTLRNFAAVVVVFRLIAKVLVEFFYFAFFYRLAEIKY